MTEQEKQIIRQMADYIEKGSQGKQQITGRYSDSVDEIGVCAMAACYIGAGVFKYRDAWLIVELKKVLKIDFMPLVTYPSDAKHWNWIDKPESVRIDDAIIALNDVAGWRFDQIVSWLRSIAE